MFHHIMFLSDEGPTLKTFDFTIRIGSLDQPFLFRSCERHEVTLHGGDMR